MGGDDETWIGSAVGRLREAVGSLVGRVTDRFRETEEGDEPEAGTPGPGRPEVPDRSTLDATIERSPGTVVLDTDFLVRLDGASDVGGQEMLAAMAEAANVVVPQVVRDELGVIRDEDRFVQVGALPEDGPSEAMERAWNAGKVAVVDEIPADDLCPTLRSEATEEFEDRFHDGAVDLTGWNEDTGTDQVQSADGTELRHLVDDEVAELVGDDVSPLRLRARGTDADARLGSGESGAILLADALDATFVGNDRDARATASADSGANVETGEFYATVAELVATDRLRRDRADGLLASLHSDDELPRDPMPDEPSERVTLPRVVDDLPGDVTHWSFAVVTDGLVETLADERFESVLAGAPVDADGGEGADETATNDGETPVRGPA